MIHNIEELKALRDDTIKSMNIRYVLRSRAEIKE